MHGQDLLEFRFEQTVKDIVRTIGNFNIEQILEDVKE